MVEIQEFRDEDAADVAVVMFESFKSYLGDRMTDEKPMSPEHWIKTSRQIGDSGKKAAWTARENGKVIGFLVVTADLKYGLGALQQVGVDPRCHAKGVGTALFQEAEKFWKAHKMRKVCTCVSSINLKA